MKTIVATAVTDLKRRIESCRKALAKNRHDKRVSAYWAVEMAKAYYSLVKIERRWNLN